MIEHIHLHLQDDTQSQQLPEDIDRCRDCVNGQAFLAGAGVTDPGDSDLAVITEICTIARAQRREPIANLCGLGLTASYQSGQRLAETALKGREN